MISFSRLTRKSLTAEQEALTWESSSGWPGHGQNRRDRPMRAAEALKISAFYRAVDLRSDSIGRLPAAVKDLNVRREVAGHYLGPVLWEKPNEAMGPFVYKKLVEYQRLVLGNAYVWIYRDRNGRPAELLPLPPGTCTPYIQPGSGTLWYIAQDPKTHDLYKLYPADLLHYKGFSTNGIEGRSLLGQASRTLDVAACRDIYEQDIYRNGGRPSGVLLTKTDLSKKPDKVTADGEKISYRDIIRREWDHIYTGPGNSMRTAVLDNDLTYTPISMSNTDAQFVENKAVSVADIARFTGVPLYLLYSGKESFESNSANGVEYVKYTIQPAVTQYEEEDSLKLLTISERARGLWVCRNMMAELRGDTAARKDFYRVALDEGFMSVNEVRRLEDLPDISCGDEYNASLNYVPRSAWPELSRLRALSGKREEKQTDEGA